MEIGYDRRKIMSLLDESLQDVNKSLELQIKNTKEQGVDPEAGLAALLTSSMLAVMDGVAATIEANNDKILDDLVELGVIKKEAE